MRRLANSGRRLGNMHFTGTITARGCGRVRGALFRRTGEYAFYWDYHGSWMRSVAVRFDQAYGKICISGSNMALRRATWEKLRFGDVEAIEDRVMQVKLFKSGRRMMQVKDAISLHGHDYTWK